MRFMPRGLSRLRFASLGVMLVLAHEHADAATVVLKKAFVEKYKDRATIETRFVVDHAKNSPNRIGRSGDDGDLHVAGRSPQGVGLPMVAEVINARMVPAVVQTLNALEGTDQSVPISGAWRLWFEHPAKTKQTQGKTVPRAKSTNPDHVFEIHPITEFDGVDVRSTFVEIPGYEAYDAKTAFGHYEKLKMTVQASGSGVQINANRAVYNYAEFSLEVRSEPDSTKDGGFFVTGDVLDEDGDVVVTDSRRMVFAPGTPPAAVAANAQPGDELHVVGIPRVNLNELSSLLRTNGKKQFTTSLPYEMIIIAVLGS